MPARRTAAAKASARAAAPRKPVAPRSPLPWHEVRRLDLNASELGVPVARLMASAGKALAREALRMAPRKGDGILVLCGKGNNGGDGLAAAGQLLRAGRDVRVLLAEPPTRGAARAFLDELPEGIVKPWPATGRRQAEAWGEPALAIDALLGIGATGEPRGAYAAMLRRLTAWRTGRQGPRRGAASRRPLLACDVPSGLGSTLAVVPDRTVTFHALKEGMSVATCGRIIVAPIGIPRAAQEQAGLGDLAVAFRPPARDSHKGDNGRVLVVAGSIPLVGAPHYVAMGAYRTGADLVRVFTPAAAADVVRGYGPHAIVHAAPGRDHLTSDDGIEPLIAGCDAAVVGPGLGAHSSTLDATRRILDLLCRAGKPTVIDADALDAYDPARHQGPIVLTPHAREFLDLTGMEATPTNVRNYAASSGAVVLRKGATDVIAGPATRGGIEVRACSRGHPTMTVGGTGDVLAGMVGALLAKGAAPFDAACAASYASKVAGETAARTWGWGATATEVADAVPTVLRQLDP